MVGRTVRVDNPPPKGAPDPTGVDTLRGLVRDLDAGEALCSAILSSTLDPLIIIDQLGEILAASRSVERVFGYTSSELIGENIRILMPEPHHSQHDGYLAHYRKTGETGILDRTRGFEVIRKDGQRIDIELSVSRADIASEELPLFIGSFRDVTDRNSVERALHASEQRLHAIFDKSFQYIGLLSPEGILLEANEASLAGTGVTLEEVVGKPFWETRWWAVSEEVREQLKDGVRRAAAGEFVRFETAHLGSQGETLNIDFSLSPVRDQSGKVVMLIPEGRNITELRQAQRSETAMLRALATLGESAAILAHEIKNPITSVNLALRAVADKLGEDEQAVLEDLVGRMQRLERVMHRTVSFTKPLKLQWSEVDACELACEVLEELRPAIEESGFDVSFVRPDDRCWVRADRQLLGEVLTNLVGNGVEILREAEAGHQVRVTVELESSKSGGKPEYVRFIVEDDGPGFPAGLRETLFKPFYTTKAKGSGLGLAFCRKVVDEHSGTIRADASELGGARFIVRIPLKPE